MLRMLLLIHYILWVYITLSTLYAVYITLSTLYITLLYSCSTSHQYAATATLSSPHQRRSLLLWSGSTLQICWWFL